ncbi:hypothetical protein [Ornithinimicrobium sp. INDO-MA30-4]|uniref:hypothetical protein n=1 Tax=Ornithinimicrobium sp. INDO-MA30-4 TaxID=2908651 RepID=UPI001F27A91A|nr:hypothetical protein [Ornithinimicrobium sp. INDO-MA30-4]UJH70424.1 hypothetical protein L0A91_15115 [Ornithinimicrobium sp. INDO-MA30-4]
MSEPGAAAGGLGGVLTFATGSAGCSGLRARRRSAPRSFAPTSLGFLAPAARPALARPVLARLLLARPVLS